MSITVLQVKYLNNIVEQGHRFIKKTVSLYIVALIQEFCTFPITTNTLNPALLSRKSFTRKQFSPRF